MDDVKLMEIGERLLHLAKKEGATDAVVSLNYEIEKSVTARDGAIADVAHAESLGCAVTAIIGARRGTVESTSLAPEDLAFAAKRAVSLAKVSTPNPYLRLSTPLEWPCAMAELPARFRELKLCDGQPAPTLRMLKEYALALDDVTRAYPRVSRTDGSAFGYSLSKDVSLTSNGFSGIETRTHYTKSTTAIAEREGEMKSETDSHHATHADGLRSDEECVRRAGEYAVRQLGAKPIATAHMPVVFDNRIASTLLGALVEAIGGESVYHKSTFLLDQLGKRIFSKGVTISESPHVPMQPGSQLYDDDGVKATPWVLVDHGTLTMWMTTLESGAKLGIPSTGHASGTSNLLLHPSAISRGDLIRDIAYGLLVTGIMGDGVNLATGDYSVGAEGFLIEHGVITRPVNRVTIAGNLRDMFAGLVQASDLSDHPYGTNAPSCFIPNMMVGGE